MSDIDWSRWTSTASTDSSGYRNYNIEDSLINNRIRVDQAQVDYEREMIRRREMLPDRIVDEMKEVTLELKRLKAERVIKEKPIKEEEEKQIFFDPEELDI